MNFFGIKTKALDQMLFYEVKLPIAERYSLIPKLLAKSWFMKQSYKIQHGLKDPKQATIHLAPALQLKQD